MQVGEVYMNLPIAKGIDGRLRVKTQPRNQSTKAKRLRIEHGPTPITREPITIQPNRINIACAIGDSFLQNTVAFRNQGIETTLDHFLFGDVCPLGYAMLLGELGKDCLGIGIWLWASAFIAIIAGLGFLTMTAQFK